MELGYFSGYFRLKQRASGGAGVILRFERVRPRDSRTFQPNRWREITPQFLDRTIRALKRWNFDLITMDEVCRRAVTLPKANRFACLTFDGGCKDVITQAYPVLSKHGVPFTVYLPTAFPDGLGEAWWLALEDMIAREDRISLVIDRKERRFASGSMPEKYDTFEFLASWMRTLPPPDLSFAIHDLCTRYSVDLAALSRSSSMDWDDLAKLAADPLVTIGSATVNYPALSNLKEADAQREMTMGKAVAETALRRDRQAFRLSVRRPAILAPRACRHGAGGRFRQRGIDDPGGRRGQGIYQSACPAADRLGRTAGLAAHDARDAVGDDVSRGQADPGQLGLGRQRINRECLWLGDV